MPSSFTRETSAGTFVMPSSRLWCVWLCKCTKSETFKVSELFSVFVSPMLYLLYQLGYDGYVVVISFVRIQACLEPAGGSGQCQEDSRKSSVPRSQARRRLSRLG